MEIAINIVAESIFFLVKNIRDLSVTKKPALQLTEVAQEEKLYMLKEGIRCVTRLLFLIAIVVIVLKASTIKLGMLLIFTIFYALIKE